MDKTVVKQIEKYAKTKGDYGITACATSDAIAGEIGPGTERKKWDKVFQTYWDMVREGRLRKNPRTNLTYVLA